MDKQKQAKAPDNNKRLALLEAGDLALREALLQIGAAHGVEDDVFSIAVRQLKSLAEGNALLHEAAKAPLSMLAAALADAEIVLEEGEDVVIRTIAALGAAHDMRMAFFASTDKLIAGLTAAGIEVAEGADLDALILDAIAKGPDGVSAGELAAIERADKAETELGTVRIELAGALEDRDAATSAKNKLAARVGELQSGTAKGKAKAKPAPEPEPAPVEPRERPELARDVGPEFGRAGELELAKLLEDDPELELAFSNGEYELVELSPVTIASADLSVSGGRRILDKPVLIRGGKYREQIHGVALLYGGEQIDYCSFPEPIAIEPGQDRQFVKAIYFG